MPRWTKSDLEAYEHRRKLDSDRFADPEREVPATLKCPILWEPPRPAMTVKPSTDEAKLNKTERAYLQYTRGLGYVWIGIQNITLKLADDTRFTPDFATIDTSGNLRLIDVKGFQREDALIKVKVAARLFPFAEFMIVKKTPSGWNHKTVKP